MLSSFVCLEGCYMRTSSTVHDDRHFERIKEFCGPPLNGDTSDATFLYHLNTHRAGMVPTTALT